MAAGYVMALIHVTDPDAYADYVRAVTPIVAAHGGEYMIRGGRAETVEGEAPGERVVVIRFPSYDAAQAWYHSDEYARTRKLRQAASTSVQILAEGV